MAASNLNVVVITGNLTADPELRSLPSGTSVCKLRVAVNTRRKNGSSGDWEDKPNYFDVTVWGAQGENCARFLSKGRPVGVQGRLDGGSGRARRGRSARQSISLPTPSSSWAVATTLPRATASGHPGWAPVPGATSRSTIGTSKRLRAAWAQGGDDDIPF